MMDIFIHRYPKNLGNINFHHLNSWMIRKLSNEEVRLISQPVSNPRLFLVLLLLIFISPIYSQQNDEIKIEKCARLQCGILLQANSEKNSVVPGMDIQYCYGIKTGERLGIGFSAGFQIFKDEFFVPFLMDIVLFVGADKKHSYLTLDAGYSPGWSERFKNYTNSDFTGGPAIGIGYGRKICIKDQYTFFINTGYQYQNARLFYENGNGENIQQAIHYHLLIINFGMMLQQ